MADYKQLFLFSILMIFLTLISACPGPCPRGCCVNKCCDTTLGSTEPTPKDKEKHDDDDDTDKHDDRKSTIMVGVFVFCGFVVLSVATVVTVCVIKKKNAAGRKISQAGTQSGDVEMPPDQGKQLPPSYDYATEVKKTLPPLSGVQHVHSIETPFQPTRTSTTTPLPPIGHAHVDAQHVRTT